MVTQRPCGKERTRRLARHHLVNAQPRRRHATPPQVSPCPCGCSIKGGYGVGNGRMLSDEINILLAVNASDTVIIGLWGFITGQMGKIALPMVVKRGECGQAA